MKISIVIMAYNRPSTLLRLLNSLSKIIPHPSIPTIDLFISIDYSGQQIVSESANKFDWPFGQKYVISHTQRLGLTNNGLFCGDLSMNYDHILILEDESMVSKIALFYAVEVINFYSRQSKVFIHDLYPLKYYTGREKRLFRPIISGFDNYFAQCMNTFGFIISKENWQQFRHWYDSIDPDSIDYEYRLPYKVRAWQQSWKKYLFGYMVQTNKVATIPYWGLVNMSGVAGTHTHGNTFIEQQSVLTSHSRPFHFAPVSDNMLIYDNYLEISPDFLKAHNPDLVSFDFDVNIHGEKPLHSLAKPYMVIIPKSKISNSELSFDMIESPLELNILNQNLGEAIQLVDSNLVSQSDIQIQLNKHPERERFYYGFLPSKVMISEIIKRMQVIITKFPRFVKRLIYLTQYRSKFN